MKSKSCAICGSKLIKHGKTKQGKQRWYCQKCKCSSSLTYNNLIKKFNQFINWLLHKNTLNEQTIPARTLARHNDDFWKYWAMPSIYDEQIDVLYIDATFLKRSACVLIARTDKHVINWYVARSENSNSWKAMLMRTPKPKVVVTDGSNGILKALNEIWPDVIIQRCTYHVQMQIIRCTTNNPKLTAGKELLVLAKLLGKIKTYEQALYWIDAYFDWAGKWEGFLKEKSRDENGEWTYKHRQLRKARRAIKNVLRTDTLFSYVNPINSFDFKIPSTNNKIEGGVNSQLKNMLRHHRGMPLEHRVKAIFWWCYYHSPYIEKPAYILKHMPTDSDIEAIYMSINQEEKASSEIEQWGDAIVWSEFQA